MNHFYVSTACQHELHGACAQACHVCSAPCLCRCHEFSGRVDRKLDSILTQIGALQRQENNMANTMDDVQKLADETLVAIHDESDKDDAIIALVQGNNAVLAALQAKLDAAIAAGADPAKLQALQDTLTTAKASSLANAQKVVDAINAGTAPTP